MNDTIVGRIELVIIDEVPQSSSSRIAALAFFHTLSKDSKVIRAEGSCAPRKAEKNHFVDVLLFSMIPH